VSFREFSWFVGSFFVRGDFDRDGGQHETPVPGHGIIGVFALLALLIVTGFLIVGVFLRADAFQDCAMHGSKTCTYRVESESPLNP
jgi:hypothetical protein